MVILKNSQIIYKLGMARNPGQACRVLPASRSCGVVEGTTNSIADQTPSSIERRAATCRRQDGDRAVAGRHRAVADR